ncbi:MAG: hypothetical protein KDA88_14585 [Planctomycetaceae bacterium]|nr:hypothetical protein [Planctomycetaceae bacterium]MCB9950805.1 hypothetical protein [Planctomycetaceae bacterium]
MFHVGMLIPCYAPTRLTASVVALCLLTQVAGAAGDWVEVEQRGVVEVRSEFAMDQAEWDNMFRELNGLQADLEGLLHLRPSNQIIEINLFRTKSSYQEFLRARVPEGVTRKALYVPGTDRGRVYVYRHWGYETDLRHEFTHALLHSSLPFVPMWLDEGFAEYFEVQANQRSHHNPHLGELKRRLLFGWGPNLANLEGKSDLSQMDGADYRECWAWVHFMMHGPDEVRQVLANYLHNVEQGNPAGQLGDHLRESIDLDAQLLRHFRQWK